jgi:molybdopterin-guanine dinucleotide biosynthesis protein B
LNSARVLGIVGWSGSGKTTLITRLMPFFAGRGVRVATLKHAHHAFDVDLPGKDSYELRKSGACEVIISSSRRWVQMHELGEAREATLAELLSRVSPCELVLVEGFKRERHPKLEVYRQAIGKSALHLTDERIVGVASDQRLPNARVPVLELHDIGAVGTFILERAEPMAQVLAALEGPAAAP